MARKINPDGTLEGFEFSEGYDPEAPPYYISIPQGEDLIDFPCSPDWVRHFSNQGLTRDYPSDFYLDKKSLQPAEVTTIYTGRYTELPAIGRLEHRLKEVEIKTSNLDKKGWGGDKYTIK